MAMDRNPPLLFLLLLILGTAVVTTNRLQTSSEPGSAANKPTPSVSPTREEAKAASETPNQIWKAQCLTTPEPLSALCAKLFEPNDSINEDWMKRPWVKRAREKVSFLIATVYDPQVTRYTLQFDRAVESIQIAAGAVGYIPDRYWIP